MSYVWGVIVMGRSDVAIGQYIYDPESIGFSPVWNPLVLTPKRGKSQYIKVYMNII